MKVLSEWVPDSLNGFNRSPMDMPHVGIHHGHVFRIWPWLPFWGGFIVWDTSNTNIIALTKKAAMRKVDKRLMELGYIDANDPRAMLL